MFKGILLKSSPGPGFPLASEQVQGGDDVGEVRDKFFVEVCESGE